MHASLDEQSRSTLHSGCCSVTTAGEKKTHFSWLQIWLLSPFKSVQKSDWIILTLSTKSKSISFQWRIAFTSLLVVAGWADCTRGTGIFLTKRKNQADSRKLDLWHSLGEWSTWLQCMKLGDFLAIQPGNSTQPCEILLCKEHCCHRWYWDKDWRILEKHMPCHGDSLHLFGTHLENQKFVLEKPKVHKKAN